MRSLFKLITRATHDLLVQYKIWKPRHRARFVFLIHPRDEWDAIQHFSFFRYIPRSFLRWILWNIWPLRIHKVIVHSPTDVFFGWTVAVPLTASMMLQGREYAKRKIQDAVRLGEGLGAKIIGLGALTPSITNGGAELLAQSNVYITNGYTTTVFFIASTVEKLIKDFRLDPRKITLGVLGAAGSVGSATVQSLVSKYTFAQVLMFDLERKKEKLFDLRADVAKKTDAQFEICYNLRRTVEAHILITATNAADFVLRTEHLSPGTIIVDDAQPSDVDPDVVRAREDVVVLEAAIVHSDMVTVVHNKELLDHHDLFSCLAESVLLSFRASKDIALSSHMLVNMEELIRDTDFRVAEYQNFLGAISSSRLEHVTRLLKQRYGS